MRVLQFQGRAASPCEAGPRAMLLPETSLRLGVPHAQNLLQAALQVCRLRLSAGSPLRQRGALHSCCFRDGAFRPEARPGQHAEGLTDARSMQFDQSISVDVNSLSASLLVCLVSVPINALPF